VYALKSTPEIAVAEGDPDRVATVRLDDFCDRCGINYMESRGRLGA